MANHTNADADRTTTPDENAFNRAPKVLSKATLAVVGVALLFLIIAGLLFSSFFNSSTGNPGGAPANANLSPAR